MCWKSWSSEVRERERERGWPVRGFTATAIGTHVSLAAVATSPPVLLLVHDWLSPSLLFYFYSPGILPYPPRPSRHKVSFDPESSLGTHFPVSAPRFPSHLSDPRWSSCCIHDDDDSAAVERNCRHLRYRFHWTVLSCCVSASLSLVALYPCVFLELWFLNRSFLAWSLSIDVN